MHLYFVRHGDPDYQHDSLTAKGVREAKALADYLPSINPDYVYLSPMGRAQKTASYFLNRHPMEAETLDWLHEFDGSIDLNINPELLFEAYPYARNRIANGRYQSKCSWDIVPSYIDRHPEIFDSHEWKKAELFKYGNIVDKYEWIVTEFDKLMEKHGYRRNNLFYDVLNGNNDNLVFICHFGVTCVIMSHLMGVSPYSLMQQTMILPTGITEFITEEVQKGIASFRAIRIGDLSHLALANEPFSLSGTFQQTYQED